MAGRFAAQLILASAISLCVAADSVADAAGDTRIQALIEQLDAEDFKLRADAEEKLRTAGPVALPMVEAALERGMSADATMTLRSIQQHYRDLKASLPTRVRMEPRYATGQAAWESLTKQAGLTFVPPTDAIPRERLASPVTFDDRATTYASALHQLQTQTGLDAVVQDALVTLVPPSRTYVRPPTDWSSLIVVSQGKAQQKQDPGLLREIRMPVTFDLDPSIKFMPLGAVLTKPGGFPPLNPVFYLTEVDAEGRGRLTGNDLAKVGAWYERSGRCRILGTVQLNLPPWTEDAAKLPVVRGELRALVVKSQKTFEASVTPNQRQQVGEGDSAIGVKFVPRAEGGWDIHIDDVPDANPSAQQICDWYVTKSHELCVWDAAGNRMVVTARSAPREPGNGHVLIRPNDALILTALPGAPGPVSPPAKVRWVVPTDFKEMTFPFELTDVDIPRDSALKATQRGR